MNTNLISVRSDHAEFVLTPLVFLLLLYGRDDSPAGPSGTNHVLVGDGQQVPLLHGQLHVHLGHVLHRLDHF